MSSAPRARKEAVFVRVPAPDDTAEFHDVTDFVGKTLPFTNPKATCAMRVSADTVAFSYLQLTKRAVTGLLAKPLEIPRGPLARLERNAVLIEDLPVDTVEVDVDGTRHRFTLERDENNVVEIIGAGEDLAMDLPKSALQMMLFLKSPSVGRSIAVGFIGHLGKPGTPDTLRRVVSKILFSMTQLSHFQVLTGITSVLVPAAPRTGVTRPIRKAVERAAVELPVWLFTSDMPPVPVAAGTVVVEVDLDVPNSAAGQLLYHVTPSSELADTFEPYREILKSTIGTIMRAALGDDDIKAIAIEVVLGEVSAGTVERLREPLEQLALTGIDLTPAMYQLHQG